jgi:DNA-binding transcriptional ArsR family regulator
MINLHDHAITQILPQVGPKAFAVLLVICKHLGVKKTAFPSKQTIMKLTNMGRDAVTRELSVLEDAGLLKKEQRTKDGKFTTNLYTVTTKLIGVYIAASDAGDLQEDEIPCTDFQATESPATETPYTESQATISIKQNGSIEQDKVLNKSNSLSNAQNKKNEPDASEKRLKEIVSKLTGYFQTNPERWEQLCNDAQVKLSKTDFWLNVKSWAMWQADKWHIAQNPVKALTSGPNNFMSWLINERNRQVTQKARQGKAAHQAKVDDLDPSRFVKRPKPATHE